MTTIKSYLSLEIDSEDMIALGFRSMWDIKNFFWEKLGVQIEVLCFSDQTYHVTVDTTKISQENFKKEIEEVLKETLLLKKDVSSF